MANLTNINNKFLVTTTGEVLVNQTAAVGTSKFQVTGDVTINNASNALLTLSAGSLDSARIEYLENGVAKVALRNSVGAGPFDDFGIFAGSATPIWNNNNLRITVKGATGNVGIGTDAPAYKLQVSGAQNANDIVINNTTTGVNLRLQMIDANGSIFTTGTKDLTLGTNNTERIRINQSGNVGIGDLSPGFKLNVTKGYTSGFAKVAKFRSGNDATFVNFDTVQVVQTDVPCLAIIETSTGTQSNEQKLTFSAGDNKAIIGSTSTVTNGMSFYTNRPVTATGFAAQGNLALHLANTGNVGIGTTSPSEKLDVRGGNIMVGGFGGGTDYGLILTPDDGSGYWNIANVTGGALTFNNSNTIGSSEAMRITGGKIGIGTTSPDRTLDVEGTGMAIFGTGDYTELMLRGQVEGTGTVRNVGAWHWSVRGDVGGDNDDLKLLRFNTGSYSGTSMQVRSDNGGVAIGVNNSGYSSQILSVKSGTSDNVFYGESSDANCFASFRDNSSTANIEYGAIGNNHVFRKDTTEYMRIDSSGKVGIGTIAPASLLEIFGGGNTLRMDSAGNTAKTFLMRNVNTATAEIKTDGNLDINIEDGSRTMRFLNGNTERMRINSSGNVGIGRTSDTAKRLDVLGPGLRMQDTSAYSSITIGASGWNQDYPYQRLDTFNSDGTGYFWAMGHRKTDGTKTVRMLISDTSSRYVKVIDQLQVSAFASNELGGSGYYPTFTTNVVIRNQGDSYFNGGNVGIGTTTPSARLQSFGAIISQTAANDPEVTLTNTGGWGVQSGGTIRVMQGFSRSGVSGDQIIFTYAATSWKSWSLDYTFTSTQGLTQGTIGGYWNNSGGQGNVENIDNHQTSVAVTHGGTGNQNNIITFTFNAPGTHINCSFVYTQSGGDGAPRGDRVTIETISNIP